MPHVGSYLWTLRQIVGNRKLLAPGAQVLVVDPQDRILLQQGTDYGLWGLPAGSCEENSSFASTAVAELHEETGLRVTVEELTPFACLSDPAIHTLRYPNGDVVHSFAMCFEARNWTGELRPEPGEVEAVDFFAIDELPQQIHPPTVVVLQLYERYRRTGRFQAR